MKFVFEEVNTLPAMAWCLKVEAGQSEVTVWHGRAVERFDDFFFEGCWNGELTPAAMLSADICAATGASTCEDALFLACSSNTIGRLCAIKKDNSLWISNSMAFIIAASGEAIRNDFAYYQEDISSVIKGLNKSKKFIPLESGLQVKFYFHCNLKVTKNLNIGIMAKKQAPVFADFSDYRQFLSHGLASLIRNANLPSRAKKFSPLVSISKGYDSVACAVLAKEVGCQDAFTMIDPESTDPSVDSGTAIASQLGLSITEYSRVAYKTLGTEWEFFALGTGGEDCFFAPMESILTNRLFISGFHGDKVWDRNLKKTSNQIIRGDPSGADLEEFRLRVGFIHVAVPFFGCRAHKSIAAISRSEEMASWTVGGIYDRPICRRIAEEAGVNRLSFGQKKQVMSRSFGKKGLDWYLGPASLKAFGEYTKTHPPAWKWIDHVLYRIANRAEQITSKIGKLSYRAGTVVEFFFTPLERYRRPLDETRQLFHWSFEKMLHRYRLGLIKRSTIAQANHSTEDRLFKDAA
ncbi:hypothetical protein [Massilia sp. ZL223]|uniref:hypothetical protein n=1 Tax=Massilia sp. ZL223 TaxID=2824904 RepID=UPI001B83F2F3|nr:hypothetical protein [Massilia sp. ZL223]MBQ5962463.1 hypothetical protein [Massilia sp. ZL223]